MRWADHVSSMPRDISLETYLFQLVMLLDTDAIEARREEVPWQRTTQAQVPGMMRVRNPVSIHTTAFSGPHPKARWSSQGNQGTGAVSPFVIVLCCDFSLLKSTRSCVEYPGKDGAGKEGWSPPVSPVPHTTTSSGHCPMC